LEINEWLNSLENYSYNVKSVLEKEEVNNNLDDNEKEKLRTLARELLDWVEEHPRTSVSLQVVKDKRKEAEGIYNSIMTKVYEKIGHTVDPEYAKQQQQQQQQQQQNQQDQQDQQGAGETDHGH